jgi:hypothetical protein
MKKTLVVVHDAGGAEIIAAYLKAKMKPTEFIAYASGPAARTFSRERIAYTPAPKTVAGMKGAIATHPESNRLLTATGWMTSVEKNALAEAKRVGLHTIVYLESWNRFRERFGYPEKGWKQNLPDEFWVGDRDAETLAKKYFPQSHVRLVPNEYFRATVARVRAAPSARDTVLLLSDTNPGILAAFDAFLSALGKNLVRVRIRFHPADARSRFDALIKKYPGVPIEKSTEPDLARDLSLARTVIGGETVALVVALKAKRKAICLPIPGQKPYLPQAGLLRPRTAAEVARLITKH